MIHYIRWNRDDWLIYYSLFHCCYCYSFWWMTAVFLKLLGYNGYSVLFSICLILFSVANVHCVCYANMKWLCSYYCVIHYLFIDSIQALLIQWYSVAIWEAIEADWWLFYSLWLILHLSDWYLNDDIVIYCLSWWYLFLRPVILWYMIYLCWCIYYIHCDTLFIVDIVVMVVHSCCSFCCNVPIYSEVFHSWCWCLVASLLLFVFYHYLYIHSVTMTLLLFLLYFLLHYHLLYPVDVLLFAMHSYTILFIVLHLHSNSNFCWCILVDFYTFCLYSSFIDHSVLLMVIPFGATCSMVWYGRHWVLFVLAILCSSAFYSFVCLLWWYLLPHYSLTVIVSIDLFYDSAVHCIVWWYDLFCCFSFSV
jgi:hypothetical protein